MTMIVHMGTELIMRLGVLDDKGNVHALKPRGYMLASLDAGEFARALEAAHQAREAAANDPDAAAILQSLAVGGELGAG